MLGEPLHQMAVVLVDAMHRKGQQHQARPGRCIDRRRHRGHRLESRPPDHPDGEFVIRRRGGPFGRRALQNAELDVRDELFGG